MTFTDKSLIQLRSGNFNSAQRQVLRSTYVRTYYIATKKTNLFVRFLGESSARKKRFEINWPLVCIELNAQITSFHCFKKYNKKTVKIKKMAKIHSSVVYKFNLTTYSQQA